MKTLLITLFVGLMSNTIAGAGTAADIPPELARLIEIERVKAKTISGADYQSGKEPTDYTLKQAEDLIRSGGAKKVISYLEKLGASGNPAGWRLLTKIYQEDESGLRNNELAYRYAIKGVEAGDVDSHRALGWILLGAGPHKNPKLTAVVWERAVALGNCVSASNLGVLYKSGGAGNSPAQIVPINFELARKWFQRSISCGNPVASKWMGDLYQHGLGVEANQETATSYYMQAALQGVPEAQYLIGQRYQSGIAVQKDVSLARHWYERALESGKTFNDGNTFFKPQLAETAISLLERQSNALENVPTAIASAEEATLASRGDSSALLKATPKPQVADLQPRANRKALIFGNDAYASVPKLENAKYDALAIADGLRRVGYQVFLETDATRSKMNAAIRKFKSTIEVAMKSQFFMRGMLYR